SGLGFDGAGNLYVASGGDGTIHKFGPTGADLGVFASGLDTPRGLGVDGAGDVFVANTNANSVREYAPAGTRLRHITHPSLFSPYGLAIGPDGNLYVVNPGQQDILKFSPTGDYLGIFTIWFGGPRGLAFDGAGNLYITGGDALRKYAPDGTLLRNDGR